jgi:hypothetical protein
MAIYPIINKETGETKVIEMSVHDIMDWYKNNDEWVRDWSQGASTAVELGEWRDKLLQKNPSWNEVLKKASKSAGSQSKISKI